MCDSIVSTCKCNQSSLGEVADIARVAHVLDVTYVHHVTCVMLRDVTFLTNMHGLTHNAHAGSEQEAYGVQSCSDAP